MSEKWATAAWHGISLRVPTDWSLVGVSGDEKKGYMRVDGPIASALEVRWSTAGGRPPNLMAKGREFLSTLEKGARKKPFKFTSKIKQEGDAVRFEWKADRIGQGPLAYCAQCDRVLIAQMVSPRDEDVSKIARVVLDSMRDHRSDGWTSWALYGLEFAVPKGYAIEKHSLMSGYLSLAFKNRGKRLIVERWGLAETMLGGDSLADWYRKDILPDIKGFRTEIIEDRIGEHQGLRVTGTAAGIKQTLKTAAASLTLHPNPTKLTGYAWWCEASNRLFSVRATHLDGEEVAEIVRDFIKCHN
ncbi:MAG: hypothetical protein N3B12_05820 [Armatimonadetes bacterium]|nr:hypothetical protein [Armatimonadota bacterium]